NMLDLSPWQGVKTNSRKDGGNGGGKAATPRGGLAIRRRLMITGSCHCGQVSFSISESPEKLVDCNCSICRRIGGLWGHVPIESVTISADPDSTIRYIQGDKTLAIHTCSRCGCTTHWENLQPEKSGHMAVNFRMCTADDIARFRVRKFDGADTWKFID
ncbi:MAG: GFA family protein, partial [Gammaproteobacteria bacterium]